MHFLRSGSPERPFMTGGFRGLLFQTLFQKRGGHPGSPHPCDPLSGLPGGLRPQDLAGHGRHRYDFDGDIVHEWQLRSADDTLHLACETDDETEWSVSRPFDVSRLPADILASIKTTDDPPETIVFEGITWQMTEISAGQYYKDGLGNGRDLIAWNYENEDGSRYLTIEQWGENAFEASMGEPVAEWQFENLLPAPESAP